MIVPVRKDDALLEDILTAPDDGVNFHLWWLGQSGFLLKWRGRHVLFDPYLSDSLTRKYSGTEKEHIRMTERCIAPERLGFVDLVVSSHAHTDHLDAATLIPLAKARHDPLPLVLPAAVENLAAERLAGADFIFHGMDAGETLELSGFTFTGIPAAHDTIERDEAGRCRFLGYIVRFGPWTLYHSGDTLWFEELPELLRTHRPDVALLPINGRDPARGVAGNLNGEEAAALAKACGAGLAVPHHFEMFTFNTADPARFVEACGCLGQSRRVLRCGERLTLESPAR